MSMSNTKCVVETFISSIAQLPDEGGRDSLDHILEPALELELDIRRVFATQRDDPSLLDPYIGIFDVFDTPENIRLTRARARTDSQFTYYSATAGALCSYPKSYLLPLEQCLRRPQGSPCTVENLDVFRENLRIFSHGALGNLTNWTNVIAAGGSVLACLTSLWGKPSNMDLNDFYQSNAYMASDIDLFLWGLTTQQAYAKMEEIYSAICSSTTLWPFICIRKANTISIHSNYPRRPIQIILRLYQSPAEILAGFDVDSACCAYNGETVFVNPRALVAMIRQCNTIDLKRRSPSYEVRLAKYADRGFEVFLPSLDRERVAYHSLYNPDHKAFPKGLARLLVLELLRSLPYHFRRLHYPKRKVVGPKNKPSSAEFAPVDRLLENDYDILWAHIPYGLAWNAASLKKLVQEIDKKMNLPLNLINHERRLHRHAIFCSMSMAACLVDCCMNCPPPINEGERQLIISEAGMYMRGPVAFIQDNPGRQFIGSFTPIDIDDWAKDAYQSGPSEDISYFSYPFWFANSDIGDYSGAYNIYDGHSTRIHYFEAEFEPDYLWRDLWDEEGEDSDGTLYDA